ncbi:bifunctional hydroxymethylpyrimidine kinase/phosphomethylpyrimidine kinase [Leucobacter sp. GX24907]
MTVARVLSIAGSDPSGGAGIQADLKAIAANGGYGMAAITALTAQNTLGVQGVFVPPASSLTAQLDSVSADVTIDAVKIGMLANAEVIGAVAAWLRRTPVPHVVLDPVMVATSGDRLLDTAAEDALLRLVAQADLITPNLAELGVLLGEDVAPDWAVALDQARRLAQETGVRVLAKGGHLVRDPESHRANASAPRHEQAVDALVAPDGGIVEVSGQRVRTRNTHGTGCSLSSAIATRVARHGEWEAAVREAKAWLTQSLAAADELEVGSGHGPIHHFAGLWHGDGLTP